jgi:hypothetical protein
MTEEKKTRKGGKALGWGMFISIGGATETRMVEGAEDTDDVLNVVRADLVANGEKSEFFGATVEVFAVKARKTPTVQQKTVVTL